MGGNDKAETKGLVKQHVNQAEIHQAQGAIDNAKADEETANLPDWFFDINPMFYDGAVSILIFAPS